MSMASEAAGREMCGCFVDLSGVEGAGGLARRESGCGDGELEGAGRDVGEGEGPSGAEVVCRSLNLDADSDWDRRSEGGWVSREGDAGSGDDGSVGVGDGAADGSGDGLRGGALGS